MFDAQLFLAGFATIASPQVFPVPDRGIGDGDHRRRHSGPDGDDGDRAADSVHLRHAADLRDRDAARHLCVRHLCGRHRLDPDPHARHARRRGDAARRLSDGAEGRGRPRHRHRHHFVGHRRPVLGLRAHAFRPYARDRRAAFLRSRVFQPRALRAGRHDEPVREFAPARLRLGADRSCGRPDRDRSDRRLPAARISASPN